MHVNAAANKSLLWWCTFLPQLGKTLHPNLVKVPMEQELFKGRFKQSAN